MMRQSLRVLIVEESDDDAAPILLHLRRGGYRPIWQRVSSAESMSIALSRQTWDLIVADTTLPQLPGNAVLELLKRSGIKIPFVPLGQKPYAQNTCAAVDGMSPPIPAADLKKFLATVARKLREAQRSQRREEPDKMLRYLAGYDPLTSLPNRTLFHEHLRRAIKTAHKERTAVALLVMSLDGFREINHTFGPEYGDSLLREVAQRFANATNGGATRGRLGGAEFAAVFAKTTEKDIAAVCAKVLKILDSSFVAREIPIDLSGSIGVAFYPHHGEDGSLLFQRANIALRSAKEHGRGFSIYQPADDLHSQQKLAYLGGLRHAIEEDQLVLHYQPKIDLKTNHTYAVEALVRWNHPQIGLLLPDRFVSLAEGTGLIHSLSRWVLRAALDQCRAWRQAGWEIPVAVNLSPKNFYDHQLPESIARLLEERSLEPKFLELEITESVIMADAGHVSETLSRLNQMGIRAYIDDFGTGYSSLGRLKSLPVAGIKIDKAFVSHMTRDDDDAVIVRSTIELGHNLGLQVIAEGVESPEIRRRLSMLHCDAAQGYSMCRPKRAADLDRWFAESPWGLDGGMAQPH